MGLFVCLLLGGVARADRGGRPAVFQDAAGGAQVGARGHVGSADCGADGIGSAEGGVSNGSGRSAGPSRQAGAHRERSKQRTGLYSFYI